MTNETISVLIVEDETIVAFDIESIVESFGYRVTNSVINYEQALKSIEMDTPNIIFMDINLKNSKNGIETAKEIQKIKEIPIIYLTAFSDDETLQRAIETNPIGYLLKPFSKEDIKSIMKLSLHKIASKNQVLIENKNIHLGCDYYYDRENELLYLQDIPISLSKNEKKLLTLLISAKGNIVIFNDIENYIWEDKTVSDVTLRSLVYRLRCKLKPQMIETVAGFGCRLVVNI
jgi:DNA-binding response OmpR family regulator